MAGVPPRIVQFLGMPRPVRRVAGEAVLEPAVGRGAKGSVYELAGPGPKTLLKHAPSMDAQAVRNEAELTQTARELGLLSPVNRAAAAARLGDDAFVTADEGTAVSQLGKVSPAVAAEIMVSVLRQIRVLFAAGKHQGDVRAKNVVVDLCDFRPKGAALVPAETRRAKLIDYGAGGDGAWNHDLSQTARLGYELLTGQEVWMQQVDYHWLKQQLDPSLRDVLVKWSKVPSHAALPPEQRTQRLLALVDAMEKDLLPYCRTP